MKILDRLPYETGTNLLTVRGETVQVKPYQIIVWVSLGMQGLLEWDLRTPRLPAILDTGNNHNCSIRSEQLVQWAGIQAAALDVLGSLRERGQHITRHAATAWLHSNVSGKREVSGAPYPLVLEDGIAVYPDGVDHPQLPLLGLRALTQNKLRTLIDGERRRVTIRAPRPRWWPFG